jgi:hypothetical protein
MLDVPATTETNKAAVSMKAWQVKFRKVGFGLPRDAIEIAEPRRLFAELHQTDPADVLAETAPQSRSSFTIIWIPPGGNAPIGAERDAEAWLRGGQDAGNRIAVRAGVRTVRIFWTFNRALIYARPENIDSALDAVVRFTVAQYETIALETEMNSTWTVIEADARLTHSITSMAQGRQSHVDNMTMLANRMKAKFLRITQALEQLHPALDESSKRMYAELVAAGALYDRLELLEEPVQFALDLYQIANTRLIEARFAEKERRHAAINDVLQVVIVILLIYPLHLFW